jgi:uncharacterized protein (DUF1810 family)
MRGGGRPADLLDVERFVTTQALVFASALAELK